MKAKILLFLCLFSFLSAQIMQQSSRADILIYHSQRDSGIARIALRILEEKQEKLFQIYGLEKQKIEVYIARDQAEYSRMAGSASAAWSMALASGNRMLVKSPSFSRQSILDFQKTLLHESVHLALSDLPLPLWFNEGLAQYEAGTFNTEQKILLAHAALQNSYFSFRKIEDLVEMDSRQAQLAYAQSVSAVDFLIRRYGAELLKTHLILCGEYRDFSAAFRNAYLMSPEYFEKRWQEHLKKSYRFYLLLDLRGTFWLFLSFLLILGYILTKLRRRKILKKWEQEEKENIIDFYEGDSGAGNTKEIQ